MYNPEQEMFVNKEVATKMVEDAVNYLGSLGDGKRFSEDEFKPIYKKFDGWDTQKNVKAVI